MDLIYAFLAVVFVAIVTTLGGLWIASRSPKWYTRQRLAWLMAIGTGLLLGIIFFDMIPHSVHSGEIQPYALMIGGILFAVVLERYLAPRLSFFQLDSDHAHDHHHCDHDHEEHHLHHFVSHGAACSAIGCLIVCAFFDGFAMRSAFSLGSETGWVASLGLLFHSLPEGVLVASLAIAGGLDPKKTRATVLIVGAALIAGALFSLSFEMLGSREIVLAFAAGILIYITLLHLLPMGLQSRAGLLLMVLSILFYLGVHHLAHEDHDHSSTTEQSPH